MGSLGAILGMLSIALPLSIAKADRLQFGGYAVANHSPCELNSLPATTRELEKLFAHSDFETYFNKNFYWSNSRVRQSDWSSSGDHSDSIETSNSYDGVDASTISYIASHGGTSSDTYMGSMGSANNGGCTIRSTQMQIGDHAARYLILSTCQGVKIGSGSNPNSPGADPSRTWKSTITAGTHCIFGYSNNMADADNYGTYLLDYIKNGQDSLAQNFMRAGRNVDPGNLPAVICFGSTSEEATAHIVNDKEFLTTPNPGGSSAWVYDRQRMLRDDQELKIGQFTASQIESRSIVPSLNYFSKNFQGNISLEKDSVVIRSGAAESTDALNLNDKQVIAIAQNYLKINKLNFSDTNLVATAIVDRGFFAEGDSKQRIIGKTVVFSQEFMGHIPLGTAGTVEVYVQGQGEVANVRTNLKQFAVSTAKTSSEPQKIKSSLASLENSLRQEFPGSKVKLLSRSVGYDLGSELEAKSLANLSLRAEFSVEKNGFGRRYIRTIGL